MNIPTWRLVNNYHNTDIFFSVSDDFIKITPITLIILYTLHSITVKLSRHCIGALVNRNHHNRPNHNALCVRVIWLKIDSSFLRKKPFKNRIRPNIRVIQLLAIKEPRYLRHAKEYFLNRFAPERGFSLFWSRSQSPELPLEGLIVGSVRIMSVWITQVAGGTLNLIFPLRSFLFSASCGISANFLRVNTLLLVTHLLLFWLEIKYVKIVIEFDLLSSIAKLFCMNELLELDILNTVPTQALKYNFICFFF